MDGISAPVITALGDLDGELLLVAPAALAVTAVVWGLPKIVRFFRKLA